MKQTAKQLAQRLANALDMRDGEAAAAVRAEAARREISAEVWALAIALTSV
jgi:hypothetical protein